MPQLLKAAGYHTYMVGKWHLGKAPDQVPAARGFERDFSLLDGAGSYRGDGKPFFAYVSHQADASGPRTAQLPGGRSTIGRAMTCSAAC
jgi:arylsulfatase A-like enzyme